MKSVDITDLKSVGCKPVAVQVRPQVPLQILVFSVFSLISLRNSTDFFKISNRLFIFIEI